MSLVLAELMISKDSVWWRSEGDGQESNLSNVLKCSETLNSDTLCFSSFKKLDILNEQNSQFFIPNGELPSISNIANKLDKLSAFGVCEQSFLSTSQIDFKGKSKILLHSSTKDLPPRTYGWPSRRKKPKFVPFEPYKACVKPIVKSQKKKYVLKLLADEYQGTFSDNTDDAISSAQAKLKSVLSDFENEKEKLELVNNCLYSENKDLQKQLSKKQQEISQLQQQLTTYSQINCELKKLLVASVGEDVQNRVQCLSEDKARMATMIRKYSEKVDKDFEEKEKISIQCDVWRSKFLASSVLIDEVARWKGIVLQRYHEAEDALRVILQEREVSQNALDNSFQYLHQIQEAFDPLHSESGGIPDSSDILTLSVAFSSLTESIRNRLLGTLGHTLPAMHLPTASETRTPGEKMAIQILDSRIDVSNIGPDLHNVPMLSSCHSHVLSGKLTVNCCGKCSGEIFLV